MIMVPIMIRHNDPGSGIALWPGRLTEQRKTLNGRELGAHNAAITAPYWEVSKSIRLSTFKISHFTIPVVYRTKQDHPLLADRHHYGWKFTVQDDSVEGLGYYRIVA